MSETPIVLRACAGSFRLSGGEPELVRLPNEYLGYLEDRNYSPRTVRAYGYGLAAFCRWLAQTNRCVEELVTDDILVFLSACRTERVQGRPGPNVVDLTGNRTDRLAPSSINLRLAAVTGLFEYRAMRDPAATSPIPTGP